jgi:hypothetical protein
MEGEWEQGLWQEAQVANDFTARRCFDPEPGYQPWNWPVCVVEVTPKATPGFNLLLHDGWSGMEDWGAWTEATEAGAQWIATARTPYRLTIAAFPQCRTDAKQQLELEVNGRQVAAYQWPDCEEWKATVEIPADLVRVGENDLVVRSAYALPPQDSGGETRNLAVGFTTLTADPVRPDAGRETAGGSN